MQVPKATFTSSKAEKVPMTREALKSRIGELYNGSIKANPSFLAAQNLDQVKRFLLEGVPAKVLQLNRDVSTGVYSRASLQSIVAANNNKNKLTAGAKKSSTFADTILRSNFGSASQVAAYRSLYQRSYRPHVALESQTLLLPEGPVPGNVQLGQITSQLIGELESAQEELLAASTTLHLLQPPFGAQGAEAEEGKKALSSSFDLKLLSMTVAEVDSVQASLRSCRRSLVTVHSQRAFDLSTLATSPQMEDVRAYLRHSETASLERIALSALVLRNSYAALHQFFLKNGTRIELIFKSGLAGAKYTAKEF